MKLKLTSTERPIVTQYKHAYIALRLSHAAMMRGEGTHASLVDHYRLEQRRHELAAQLPETVVARIETSIDMVYGFPIDADYKRTVNE